MQNYCKRINSLIGYKHIKQFSEKKEVEKCNAVRSHHFDFKQKGDKIGK